MSSLRLCATAFVVLAIVTTVSAPISAQDTSSIASAIVYDSTLAANTVISTTLDTPALTVNVRTPSLVSPAPVALRALERTDAPFAPKRRAQTSRSVAMMVVGGAALIVGSVIDGDSGRIIMIGGGVVGLIGLWNYLK